MIQDARANSCNTTRYTMSAGASPNDTISASESNSRPNGAVLSPQASEPAVEYIKNAGAENEPDGRMKKRRRFVGTGPLNQCALDDLESGGKSAKQVARCHQVGQQINLWMVLVHSGNRAITLAPPFT